ncbi:unnamed protein product [Adineta ricciae]|uniref:Uncharacterized protein n=1 Tax=Adineta ricciae TaxID=249248 RepID=A0A815CBC4_ADIRI|nr:unnamed protein product [Adineta ricciae]
MAKYVQSTLAKNDFFDLSNLPEQRHCESLTTKRCLRHFKYYNMDIKLEAKSKTDKIFLTIQIEDTFLKQQITLDIDNPGRTIPYSDPI